MPAAPPPLEAILETVVYCDSGSEEAVNAFYRDTLGLAVVSPVGFRLGSHLLLVFNADESSVQDDPPPHGARGPVHTCFLTDRDRYDDWKGYLQGAGVSITREIDWNNGARSFYFEDPAGNVLEIADGDMWRR